jgi:hypothetical protein
MTNNTSILERIKEAYLIWLNIVPHMPKHNRYTIGERIENKFLDLLELTYATYFSSREVKMNDIPKCILVLDTLKFFISVTWTNKLISHKQCEEIALKLDEIGKIFGGWLKNLNNPEKKNRAL